MQFVDLQLNRFLGKEPNQDDSTKGSIYTGINPTPKRGNDGLKKIGKTNGNDADGGAPNIITATVITSCLIQTSALPSRVEMAGNDTTFYDDTFVQGGKVIGDTSRIVFTHDLNSGQGFIIEKRASTFDTYDNVLSIYSPEQVGHYNYFFLGRQGSLGYQSNLNYIELVSDTDTSKTYDPSRGPANGATILGIQVDGVQSDAGMGLYWAGNFGATDTGVIAAITAVGDGTANDKGRVEIGYLNPSSPSTSPTMKFDKRGFKMENLPTSSAGLPAGYLYNSGGTLKVA